jgi:ATP/maltotriose-dependent transcriptional regulator MalT
VAELRRDLEHVEASKISRLAKLPRTSRGIVSSGSPTAIAPGWKMRSRQAAGVNNRGIARRTFLSERAIERHVTNVFDTLGITATGQANRRVLPVLAYLRAAAPA